MDRRAFLKYLLATPAAAYIDYEQLLWVPSPQIVVPELPYKSIAYIVASVWEEVCRSEKLYKLFERDSQFFDYVKLKMVEGSVEINPKGLISVRRIPLNDIQRKI